MIPQVRSSEMNEAILLHGRYQGLPSRPQERKCPLCGKVLFDLNGIPDRIPMIASRGTQEVPEGYYYRCSGKTVHYWVYSEWSDELLQLPYNPILKDCKDAYDFVMAVVDELLPTGFKWGGKVPSRIDFEDFERRTYATGDRRGEFLHSQKDRVWQFVSWRVISVCPDAMKRLDSIYAMRLNYAREHEPGSPEWTAAKKKAIKDTFGEEGLREYEKGDDEDAA